MKQTTKPPTVGRILHAYSDRWHGPRPAIVTNGFGGACANINVFLDGANDQKLLAEFRSHSDGNTFSSVTCFDLDPGEKPVSPSGENCNGGCRYRESITLFCVWPV